MRNSLKMIEAIGHRIVLKLEQLVDIEADKTKALAENAGIFLPDSIKENLENEAQREQASVDRGYVVAIGPTAFKDFGGDPWISVGDYVAFARFSGKIIKDPFGTEEFVVTNDEDIVCKFYKEEV